MDPLGRAQSILLCDSCKVAHLQSRCERCHVNLCKFCVGEHLEDSYVRHNVVPYKYRKSPNYPKCQDHAKELCTHYCEKCDIPICIICVYSDKHKGHEPSNILQKLSTKTKNLQRDLEELENGIYPRYRKIATDVQTEKTKLEMNYWKLTRTADQHGEVLHQEITAIVNQRKFEIAEIKSKHLAALNKNADEITNRITELRQIIQDLKKILNSNDVSLTSTYKSRNPEFRTLPLKAQITLPSFSPQKINKGQLNEMFGSLSSLPIMIEHDYTMTSRDAVSSLPIKPINSPETVLSPPVKPLLDEPQLTATIDTGYKYLLSVSCLNDEQFWTCGNSEIMKLLNLQGTLITSIQTKSGNYPWDITVTRNGDLVYTDPNNKTVNLVKNDQIRTVITLQGWRPRYVCSTACNDLLVTMDSDDETQSKVVHFSGSKETQTIQFDNQGLPLYSSGHYKYISENRNLDICVADHSASAVVVVNQSGKLRFRYTGHPSDTRESFNPVGIATDSQSHILTADFDNNRIHILDHNGQFLRYIQSTGLRYPWGLCMDIRDNLFVANGVHKVKKIQFV